MEEIAPHGLEKNGKPSGRAASGKDYPPLWRVKRIDHRRDEFFELFAREDMAHRNGYLPIAALQALDTCKRRTPEVFFKRSGYGIGLLGGQKAQMELLFVVDEVSRLCLCGIGALKRGGEHRHCAKYHCMHGQDYNTKRRRRKPSLKDSPSQPLRIFW